MITIADVLSRDEMALVQEELAKGRFVDGDVTAGPLIKSRKNNLQMTRLDPEPTALDRMILSALNRDEKFRSYALPKRFMPPLFARYEPGMAYGPHVDGVLMGVGEPVRADLSVTLFLNAPEDYDGGELVIRTSCGEQAFKLPAGYAVVYPSTSEHRVAAVTHGRRTVAVMWVQSYVRDQDMRELLYDLGAASIGVARSSPDSLESQLLFKTYANLYRKAAEA